MSRFSSVLPILRIGLLAVLAFALSVPAARAEARTWRNEDGKKLEAELVGLNGDGTKVIFAKPDAPDQIINYPLAYLIESDRKYIDAWMRNRESVIGQVVWGQLVKPKAKKSTKKSGKGKKAEEEPEADPADADPAELFTELTETPGNFIKYYVLYFSGRWSPHDRAFTPKLAEFYRSRRPKNPAKSTSGAGVDWEVVLISADRSAADLAAYMDESEMPWPALQYEAGLRSPLVRFRGPGLPCLVVVDPTGKVLIDSFDGVRYRGAETAMEDLETLLEKGPEGLAAKTEAE